MAQSNEAMGRVPEMVNELIERILHLLPGQVFSVKRAMGEWTQAEREKFGQELQYLTASYSMDEIAQAYLFYTNGVMEETKYFKQHGDYRCHSFAEVDAYLYADPVHMERYMIGLQIAEYLWLPILNIHRFFTALIQDASGKRYLEIGPGHGKYFSETYHLQRFQEYDAVDVSETAIEMTRRYMERDKNAVGGYRLFCQDAATFSEGRYDFIVIQEVLEHIEDPEGMLRCISGMLARNGRVYALFPINAPSPAHIFLFRSIEHVKGMAASAGFRIVQEEYITAGNVPLGQAEGKKLPINACLVLMHEK